VNVLLVLATSGGGVGRHVAELAAGLAGADSVSVTVAGPADTERDFGFTAAGAAAAAGTVGFEPLDVADRPRPLADRRAVRRLRAVATGTDVVHAHGLRAGALAVLAVRRIRPWAQRPKVVVTLHNALVSGGLIAVVHAGLERIVARGADVVLVVSADLGQAIGRRGARDVRPAIVPAPPIGPAQRSADDVRREIGVLPTAALLVTVARLAPQKGLDVLLDAVARLAADKLEVRAVLAGGGPLAAELTADARARDLPLTLLGPRSDVADLLAAADVVVVPSRWEGQPLIVQEALRTGAAIVATDAGGTAALTQDGAVLVRPGDPGALAEAIAALLAHPATLADLRERSLVRGQALPTADDALQQVLAVYRSLTRAE
jgi:glycosyltransferase involved in cell wall biosynthesis